MVREPTYLRLSAQPLLCVGYLSSAFFFQKVGKHVENGLILPVFCIFDFVRGEKGLRKEEETTIEPCRLEILSFSLVEGGESRLVCCGKLGKVTTDLNFIVKISFIYLLWILD